MPYFKFAVVLALLITAQLHAEENPDRARLTLRGLKHEFTEKESRILQQLLEKNTIPANNEGRKEEFKAYGHLTVGNINYEIWHGDLVLSRGEKYVKLPDDVHKNLRRVFDDTKLNDANTFALLVLILTDWINQPPSK